MLGYSYLKARPTDHVFFYSWGRVRRQGLGMSGFVFRPWATVATVPMDSRDDIFAVEAMTKDYQTVTVQGLLTFRIADAVQAVSRQDFSIDLKTGALTAEPMKQVVERLRGMVQTACRDALVKSALADALSTSDALSQAIRDRVSGDEKLKGDGIAVDRVLVLSVKPTPEIRKALEASMREQLLRQSDAATFERRRAAVADEHDLKLREQRNERQLAETNLSDELALEAERRRLAAAKAETAAVDAKARADALAMELAPLTAIPPQRLAAIALKIWAERGVQLSTLSLGGDSLTDLKSLVEEMSGKAA
jgi:regulator of protease activity HflC (stomatin/prohibitin superfamily)